MIRLVAWIVFGDAPPTTADPFGQLTSIGIGAIIAAPFIYLWRDERKQRIAGDERERTDAERRFGILIAATETLERVERGMAAQVNRVSPDVELDDVRHQLRRIAEDLRDIRGGR